MRCFFFVLHNHKSMLSCLFKIKLKERKIHTIFQSTVANNIPTTRCIQALSPPTMPNSGNSTTPTKRQVLKGDNTFQHPEPQSSYYIHYKAKFAIISFKTDTLFQFSVSWKGGKNIIDFLERKKIYIAYSKGNSSNICLVACATIVSKLRRQILTRQQDHL